MRHATQAQRLSRPSDQRQALVHGLIKTLMVHGQVETTLARAKSAQRLADRLVTLGKDGSIHARRRSFRVLQDRTLVKRLFADVAPAFVDIRGGYTRVVRLSFRRGDGAQRALLSLSRPPVGQPARPTAPPPRQAPSTPDPKRAEKRAEEAKKPKRLFEGLRSLWGRREKGSPQPAP